MLPPLPAAAFADPSGIRLMHFQAMTSIFNGLTVIGEKCCWQAAANEMPPEAKPTTP
jgi:hypothetical protein